MPSPCGVGTGHTVQHVHVSTSHQAPELWGSEFYWVLLYHGHVTELSPAPSLPPGWGARFPSPCRLHGPCQWSWPGVHPEPRGQHKVGCEQGTFQSLGNSGGFSGYLPGTRDGTRQILCLPPRGPISPLPAEGRHKAGGSLSPRAAQQRLAPRRAWLACVLAPFWAEQTMLARVLGRDQDEAGVPSPNGAWDAE